ncbi:MAG TPA: peptide chain release factor N(5)-glutamine methyltransferase [Bacilli bacterium]
MSMQTIREAFLQASSFLREEGCGEARQSASLLLQSLLGWDSTRFLLDWQQPFPDSLKAKWEEWLKRRAAGEPVQYITGEQEFCGLAFSVNPAVLIPRPETELLAEEMIRIANSWRLEQKESPVLLDIGTGSGALAVAFSLHCPAWRVVATDISPKALATAKRNAAKLGAGNIRFLQGDLLEPAIRAGVAPDIIVSNPPYIPAAEIPTLQTEVKDFEPITALDGGADGLDCYRRLVGQLTRLERLPSVIGLETGIGQAGKVAEMLRVTGVFADIRIVRDLSGIDRHVIARNGNCEKC